MDERPTVFVVDDEIEVLRSLRFLIESEGHAVETFESGQALLDALDGERPGCLVLDVRMPGMDGLRLQEELARRAIRLPVILVSAHADVPLAVRAMRAGAVSVLEKPYRDEALLEQVAEAIRRDAEQRLAHRRHEDLRRRVDRLTPREHEVMDLVVRGQATKQIAHALGISPRTVEIHRARVMDKMEARSVAELVHIALGSA